MNKYFKKADIVLLVVILLISAVGFIALRSSANDNSMIEISIEGKVTERHPLSVDAEYEIKSEYGYNIIQVENRQVRCVNADCKNGDCTRFGAIKNEGQVILCLPHKLSVRIVGGEAENDAISY